MILKRVSSQKFTPLFLNGHAHHVSEQAHTNHWVTFDNFWHIYPESWTLGSLVRDDEEDNAGQYHVCLLHLYEIPSNEVQHCHCEMSTNE